MEKPDKLRPISSEDFRRYQQGEMSFEEQHAFEKQLLEDAFTAAAYEGFLALEADRKDLTEIRLELNRKLENRLGNARKILVPIWVYGAAASFFISIGIIWTVFLTGPKMQGSESKKEFSARKVPENPSANEQEEQVSPDAPLSLKSPPPAESKPGTDRIAHSSTVENSVVADRYEKETLFAEPVPRQQQILEDKNSRIASAEKAGSEHGLASERIISRNRESEMEVPAIVPADENSAPDSADKVNISGSAGDVQKSKNEIQVAAAPMVARKQNSSVRSSAGAMPEKGWENYQDYLEKNAGSTGINAVVTVTFTVQPGGSLTQFSATGDSTLHRRAIRMIRNGPAWLPDPHAGNGGGQPVKITIRFTE